MHLLGVLALTSLALAAPFQSFGIDDCHNPTWSIQDYNSFVASPLSEGYGSHVSFIFNNPGFGLKNVRCHREMGIGATDESNQLGSPTWFPCDDLKADFRFDKFISVSTAAQCGDPQFIHVLEANFDHDGPNGDRSHCNEQNHGLSCDAEGPFNAMPFEWNESARSHSSRRDSRVRAVSPVIAAPNVSTCTSHLWSISDFEILTARSKATVGSYLYFYFNDPQSNVEDVFCGRSIAPGKHHKDNSLSSPDWFPCTDEKIEFGYYEYGHESILIVKQEEYVCGSVNSTAGAVFELDHDDLSCHHGLCHLEHGPLLLEPTVIGSLNVTASSADKTANLTHARTRVLEASKAGANLIVLPECFNSPYGCQYFPSYAETLLPTPPSKDQSPSYHALSALAAETKTYLLGGSIPEFVPATKKYHNTSLLFSPQGDLLATHRKLHLFDIDIPGKITFRESDVLSPGNKVTIVDLPPYGKIGLAICYDIRFPELATIAARRGAFLLLYPGAFNLTTGALHWELQARARAMDNQVYVGVCSPARDMEATYHAWGHSMVVGPDAGVVGEAGTGEEVVYAELRGEAIGEVRKGIPLYEQRRFDVYPDVGEGKIRFEE